MATLQDCLFTKRLLPLRAMAKEVSAAAKELAAGLKCGICAKGPEERQDPRNHSKTMRNTKLRSFGCVVDEAKEVLLLGGDKIDIIHVHIIFFLGGGGNFSFSSSPYSSYPQFS